MTTKSQSTHKQHTVPQFYLRRFAGQNEKLFAYDKANGRSFEVSVRDAAQKHGFFSIPELDGENGAGWFAEAYFGSYETPAAAAIRTFIRGVESGLLAPLHEEARWVLSKYIAVQYQRTHAARGRLADINRN